MTTKNSRKTGISILFGTALVLGICLFSAGCLSASPGTDGDALNGTDTKTDRAPGLNGTHWLLTSYDTVTGGMNSVIEGSEITLEFDEDGGIAGSAGVNRYFASYESDGDALSFGLIGSTMMAGPEDLMTQETDYLTLLNETVSFSGVGDELNLCDSDGNVLLVFERAVPPAAVPLTGTTWMLTSYNNGNEAVVSVIAGTEITLNLDEDGEIAGSAGCNTYFASYETDGNALSFGMIGSTEMFCEEPEGIMAQETTYLNLLNTAAGYVIERDSLTVQDSSGKTILTFTATV
ncbi:META domain-containing protein [Methanogenium organophilum]|uniref:META domain-containing protein n=1 Tax=Methanogenium organophilum TaxID=2199 RepID=A0A9X9T7U1_METOG|nr:META domain-containing protein [Methanogenium organophilum]WAI01748.1 META domain-containing protein [Methanogenium organophilum]